ncbi:MAG TPA: PAS domain-containing sensor histidine kinase [Methanocellaceae archaeon]
MISNIPGMIYRCYEDNGETMEYVSEGCLGLTGYRPSDLMDHKVAYRDLIHREDRELVFSGIQQALRNAQPFNLIYRILDSNGREKWVCEQGRGSYLKNGEQIVRDGFVTDITASVEAERKLEEARMQADLFVDLMGHDVNNMNQVALGFLELALEKMERNGRLEIMDKVLLEKPFEALKSNSRLVDNVRKIHRERSGKIEPTLIDLGKIVEDVKSQFMDIVSRDIKITYVPADGCHVMANELLSDVFLNLVGNAIKHSSGPLSINMKLESEQRKEGKFYRVSIEDNGPGIPDDRKKILLDQACVKKRRKTSKGFGLCLTRTLLEDFNGSIWIENRVPLDHTKGSRFVVLLPAAEK